MATASAAASRQKFEVSTSRPDSTRISSGEKKRGQTFPLIGAKEQADIFPSYTALSKPPSDAPFTPLRRPEFYTPLSGELNSSMLGNYRVWERDRLVDLVPEGLGGDIPKDITMISSLTTPVGLMFRQCAYEAMLSLEAEETAGEIRRRGFLIDGPKGSGKSCVLANLVIWARERGWLVIYEPRARRYMKEISEIRRSPSGLFIQAAPTRQFLETLSVFNREMLGEIPVDMRVYGKSALDGYPHSQAVRRFDRMIEKAVELELRRSAGGEEEDEEEEDEEEEEEDNGFDPDQPIPAEGITRRWRRSKKVFERSLKRRQEVESSVAASKERVRLWHEFRSDVELPSLRDRLPNPKSLWEICEFGMDHEAFAVQSAYELFQQLKRQTKFPLMIAVDDWSDLFHVSQFLSIVYDSTQFDGWIPAYHLTMPRLLCRWDGGQFKRGVKVCATSWYSNNPRDFRPELHGIRKDEVVQVPNFSPHEFATYVAYMQRKRVIKNFPLGKLEYFRMMCGGNGQDARRLLGTFY
uniref:Small ribosomal subunit protein mS29 n=1 Tax=Chromera velia CCMP2878 TaxID=1169474 RepID=A0A0G4HZP7_9ALVE|eukprot:Cvel_9778.t1-p1 / transcript=Cvel_9778.t1 / gene=Cvel_9778 / organism=Chromera_velia_CCMP2878 / gene_product=hypothetical protein / transcript_product=hypothetical protein / location=Cvel_scaffold573:54320-56518(-) / protein_length=522 / sequence_SO=supercontig / SO=protein_coding / is_pseudo=false